MIRTIRSVVVAAIFGASFSIALAYVGGAAWALGAAATDLFVVQPVSRIGAIPTWQKQIASVGIVVFTLWSYWRFFFVPYYEPVPMVPPWMFRLVEDPDDEDQEDEQ